MILRFVILATFNVCRLSQEMLWLSQLSNF